MWAKLPQNLLTVKEADGWQSLTKNCQRFLTGKKLQKNKKSKSKEKAIIVSAISHGNAVPNNELNAKFDFNAIASELKSLGIVFNKSLCDL